MKKRKARRKTIIEERLQSCSREETILFAWLCAVRCLPFLEEHGTFNYWPESERQKLLLSALMALDATAYATCNNARHIADYAANDAFDVL